LFEFQRPAGCNGFLSCSFSRRLPFQRSLFPSFKVSLTLSLFFFFFWLNVRGFGSILVLEQFRSHGELWELGLSFSFWSCRGNSRALSRMRQAGEASSLCSTCVLGEKGGLKHDHSQFHICEDFMCLSLLSAHSRNYKLVLFNPTDSVNVLP
jgi:hypothetical protein